MYTFYTVASVIMIIAASILLGRSLPAQNVAFVLLLLIAIEAAYELMNEVETWQVGMLFWPAAIILIRGAIQWLLRARRHLRNYGLFVIGLTSFVIFTMGLASRVIAGAQLDLDELFDQMVRFFVTAACLIFVSPWLINKRVRTSSEARK